VDQNYIKKEAVAAKTSGPDTAPGRPGSATERTALILDAKDTSSNPGDQVNKYKEILSHLDYFKNSLNPTNGVRLAGTPQQQATTDGKPFVQFTLECRFSDKTQ
jgi:hypothetical protein